LGDITTGTTSTDTGLALPGQYPAALFTEVSGSILSYAINTSQIGTRNTGVVGGIFRLDTRTGVFADGAQSFVVFGVPTGGSELSRIIVSLQNGTTVLVPNGGNVGVGITSPSAKLHVSGNLLVSNGITGSGSLFVTGSQTTLGPVVISGSLNISGSVTASNVNLVLSGNPGPNTLLVLETATNKVFSTSNITASLFGTASNAVSSSFATSASWAPSSAGSGVTSITVSDGLTGGVITTTGTISLNTGSAHFLDGVKKELNTEGVISSSQQINTGSFSGSLTGTLLGTASFATSASFATTSSYALNATATVPAGTISSSLQFNSLTLPFTGSFTGSFKGDGTGLTGVTATAFPYTGNAVISGSLIITGSNALSITGSATVLGAFQATTKSFKIDHQILLGKKLIYGVLEGPEHGVYVRGRLTQNNIIQLPEEWEWLVDPDSITVQLTPIGIQQTLYVQNIENNTVIINSNTPIDCFYFVQATRKDVAPLTTVE
jgi:hypothetical protein